MTGQGPLSDEGLIRLLDHTGQRLSDPHFDSYAADLDADRLRAMWRDMTITRAFDAEATSLQRQGELGLWVQSTGQEAAQIGSGHALVPSDYAFPSYREHGVALTRGVDLPEILGTFRGLEHSSWNPKAHGFHVYTLVIGAHSLHAVGYAMAMDRDGLVGSGDPQRDGAVICYFGDGATSQGDVNEALNFAAVYNAPVVFFCQNNQFAISEPTTRQTIVPIAQRAAGFGLPGIRVDGNDVIASYAVTQWAMARARSGQGPVFIEAFTYRMGAHTTSDDPTRYRLTLEEDYWRERDPIARLDAYLTSLGELPQSFRDDVAAEAKALGERTRAFVKSAAPGNPAQIFDHVYAEPHATVSAERAWFEKYEQSFVDSAPAGGHR
jgi:2-oxoisovalerate dehydrogenase E1 component alpha subunit